MALWKKSRAKRRPREASDSEGVGRAEGDHNADDPTLMTTSVFGRPRPNAVSWNDAGTLVQSRSHSR